MPKFTNADMMFFGIIALLLLGAWAWMNAHPSHVMDTQAPLPSGLYTNGSISNGMDVTQRTNFQQQPYGQGA